MAPDGLARLLPKPGLENPFFEGYQPSHQRSSESSPKRKPWLTLNGVYTSHPISSCGASRSQNSLEGKPKIGLRFWKCHTMRKFEMSDTSVFGNLGDYFGKSPRSH